MAGKQMPSKMATHKVGGYNLVSKFPGYNARQDATTLPPGTLIAPSQNVLVGTSGRVGAINGYTLDGAASAIQDSGILSNFDFANFKDNIRNMRAGFLSASPGGDGKLQYRYITGTSTVNWVTLKSSLSNIRLSFCEYWDNVALVKLLLWVDGTNNIFAWNGAITTVASATATTITKQGTNTWAQEGFSQTGTRSITINGVTGTYTGGETTTTLTGVSVDFSATAAGAIVHQEPVTVALSAMTGILATFAPTVIGCGRTNQVYVGSSNSNSLYLSKVNNYQNYVFTTPGRLAGEGNLIPLDAPPIRFIAMENRNDPNAYDMHISEGRNRWAVIRATLSTDLTAEKQEHIRLKSSPLQGARGERLVGKMKNHIMFVGYDNVANFMGYTSFEQVPEMIDFSWKIVDDMKSYDFTDGSIFYYKNYIYIAIPKAGIIRVYNMTDQTQQSAQSPYKLDDIDPNQPWFWEAPITYPLSGFYVDGNGDLFGHSYTSSESYKLFTGGSLNGQQIDAKANFAYQDYGDRTQSKGSNELWVEGYISQNTSLNATVISDLAAFQTTQTTVINGNDSAIVAYGAGGHSLGTSSLGSQPLGGYNTSLSTLPAWFHVAKTYIQGSFFLEAVSFSTKGIDLKWEIICYGTNASMTNEGNNNITQ
jgi:hypothetical protein